MRLVKFAVGGVGALIILVVVIGLLLPRTATVTRTAVVNADAATIYRIVNGFERFPEWSPWQELDPDQRIELTGPRAGVGAEMTWASPNPAVGSGRQKVIAADPDRHVRVALNFEGFPGAIAEFSLAPRGAEATVVTWSLDADFGYHPLHRWFGIFFDTMVGPDLEQGLANLKRLTEAESP